jgi:hypothetical protein
LFKPVDRYDEGLCPRQGSVVYSSSWFSSKKRAAGISGTVKSLIKQSDVTSRLESEVSGGFLPSSEWSMSFG